MDKTTTITYKCTPTEVGNMLAFMCNHIKPELCEQFDLYPHLQTNTLRFNFEDKQSYAEWCVGFTNNYPGIQQVIYRLELSVVERWLKDSFPLALNDNTIRVDSIEWHSETYSKYKPDPVATIVCVPVNSSD